jgi:6,7-dimethyl-8-ribityllumazine synthase
LVPLRKNWERKMKEVKGKISGKGKKIGIVVSRFNELVVRDLLKGALEALEQFGVKDEDIEVLWVPGSFEIPLSVKKMLQKEGPPDGVIALGCLIRGETPHFDLIASEVAKGIQRVSLEESKPVIFGVVTAETLEQAQERAGGKLGNRGRDAVLALLETLDALEKV